MKVRLSKKPKNPTIIDGFPGFGMVGSIATEFLIQHLKTEQIGKILFEDMPAMVAIHEGKLVEPFSIYYNAKYNLVILHAIASPTGAEWRIAEGVHTLARELAAKEIISLEGIGSNDSSDSSKIFYYATSAAKEKILKKQKIEPLNEGIVLGITSALLMKSDKIPVTCLFAGTQMTMPDSKAAAKLVEALDKYLQLKVDTKPLLEMAEKFETKLRDMMGQAKSATKIRDRKQLSYMG